MTVGMLAKASATILKNMAISGSLALSQKMTPSAAIAPQAIVEKVKCERFKLCFKDRKKIIKGVNPSANVVAALQPTCS